MMNRGWISGKELMERWQVKPLDLVDLVLYDNLHVYEPDGRLIVDFKYENEIRINHPGPFPPSPPEDNPTVYDLILNSAAYDFEIPAGFIPPDYIPLANKIEHCMFKISEVKFFEKEHNLILQNREETRVEPKKERKKTEVQIIKEKVREKARELWRKDPTITIADMFVNNEISEIAVRKNGEIFAEKTIRDWIKDLCPDRSPGRRPKKNPKQGTQRFAGS